MRKTKVEIKLIKSTDQKGGTDQDSPRKCEVQISTLQPESRGGLQITKIEKIKGTDQPLVRKLTFYHVSQTLANMPANIG